jgi:hypothetical protein
VSCCSRRWTATRSARCWSQRGLGTAGEHELISLLEINGLRISEALVTDIDHLGSGGGPHPDRAAKGGKLVTIPFGP